VELKAGGQSSLPFFFFGWLLCLAVNLSAVVAWSRNGLSRRGRFFLVLRYPKIPIFLDSWTPPGRLGSFLLFEHVLRYTAIAPVLVSYTALPPGQPFSLSRCDIVDRCVGLFSFLLLLLSCHDTYAVGGFPF
jgi:hypothetical protein